MKIGIVGAGAIGGWIGAKLASAGNAISVLARNQTLVAVQERGIGLRDDSGTQFGPCRASAHANELGVQDVVIIAVKSHSLPALAPALGPMMGRDTLVVPMLNGVPWWFLGEGRSLLSVDPDLAITGSIPRKSIIGCVVHASASVPVPGVSHLQFCDRLIIGEPGGGTSDRVETLQTVLADAGISTATSGDIRTDIWYKLWGNMTLNPMSALTLSMMENLLDDPLLRDFALRAMEEARAMGALLGCPITQSGENRLQLTRKLGAFKTSMLQDVEAGRSIELDALLGAPLEIAQQFGVPAPFLSALFGLARTMGRSRGLYPV